MTHPKFVSLTLAACLAAWAALSPPLSAEGFVAETPEAAAADADFPLQGEYVAPHVGYQIVALGDGQFEIVRYNGGLPGAGWDGTERQAGEDDSAGVRDLIAAQSLKRVERASPTLGASPPSEAIVLFDGTQRSLEEHWQPGAAMTPDGLLISGATSRDTFADYSLHVEFRTPWMPEARGQGRGNSGVYHQGRYETQVLDSFGLEGRDNECGGLYSVRAPDLNMCLPPLAWQTYDVDFTAARWDAEGKRTAPARITVRLNGVVVHQSADIPGPTTAAPVAETREPGPIHLQDHGNPVRYRNIWIVRRDAEREARRPIVPAFERFHAGSGETATAGGRLLISELGCANCHAELAARLTSQSLRSGPVLDGVGQRARAEWLAKFIEAPHAVKPGTTMPALFDGMDDEQRRREVQALVSFLTRGASPPTRSGDRGAGQRGEALFREIGCVACHAPRSVDGAPAPVVNPGATVPLPELPAKYTTMSLAAFLRAPHAVRPGGRMPAFGLNDREALELASYLVGDSVSRGRPNVRFASYNGNWDNLPDFEALTPRRTGLARGLDLGVARRGNNFGIRFDAWWNLERTGQYRFFLGSDDGSRLWIDGVEVVANDGVHPHQENVGRAQLTAGVHHVRVDYFQGGGEWTLTLDFDGSGFPRQSLEPFLKPSEEEALAPPSATPVEADGFAVDLSLVDEGRRLFQERGCAACHQATEEGGPLLPTRVVPSINSAQLEAGCLAPEGASSSMAPRFGLNANQRAALRSALEGPPAVPADHRASLVETLSTFNCYACHQREGTGGPERDRNPLFLTDIPEMGDEGRIPPPLDGVGDKLREDWLRHVLRNGAKDRPYMKSRMPQFEGLDADRVAQAFIAVDRRESEIAPPVLDEAPHRVQAAGRKLAGNGGLACVKCHTFGQYPASGIQAINLQTMARRVREDWFHRYLVDPQQFRPGTRMPTTFIDGVSAVADVYEGSPELQTAALWTWLLQGEQAGVPEGVLGESIELIPAEAPILYRNFLAGLSPRGIAVGYPERAHLAWDAERMSLALVWHGRFLDAGKHWTGRGVGTQGPLGDHIMRIDATTPIAELASRDAAWPMQNPREAGYAFRGYRLDGAGRPTFRYDVPLGSDGARRAQVEDSPIPAPDLSLAGDPGFRRTLRLTAEGQVENLYFRAAQGERIEPAADGRAYVVDGLWQVRVLSDDARMFVRESNGRSELLLPLRFENGVAEVVEEILW
ncbi:MAG: DUF1080 domain-containing protein [Planctomyces sp.]|nr:DUF1080 domain-containing protein [Planctomyces sp.]